MHAAVRADIHGSNGREGKGGAGVGAGVGHRQLQEGYDGLMVRGVERRHLVGAAAASDAAAASSTPKDPVTVRRDARLRRRVKVVGADVVAVRRRERYRRFRKSLERAAQLLHNPVHLAVPQDVTVSCGCC